MEKGWELTDLSYRHNDLYYRIQRIELSISSWGHKELEGLPLWNNVSFVVEFIKLEFLILSMVGSLRSDSHMNDYLTTTHLICSYSTLIEFNEK